MRKVFVSLLLAAILSASVMSGKIYSAQAERERAEVYLDGRELKLSSEAFVKNGRAYMPFKDLFNELNMKVVYEPTTKEVSAENELLSMKFTIGKPSVTINGVTQKAEPSIVENGVVYIPISYLNKEGTKLNASKHPAVNDIIIEGRMIRKYIYNSTEYYFGEGIIKKYGNFVPDGKGKRYKKDVVIEEPYTKDGETGRYKDGEMEGWFIFYSEEGHKSKADYMIVKLHNGGNVGTGYFYAKDGTLLYTREYDE
ncbi:copper amine oxidase N-terminal domain-containing protein [Paenibacillus alvei]|uniref:Copper amine oxidase N-terminal domain-containing protein n=1 Tax=Paenibacillus alvei TaxID=44250 RepID=A0AAP7A5Y4_PAEAL|nr:copper amine oxidase N-terminal domain-containing protein [Paenibacillus alvei]NOJ73936.1 copper amine oxidase N-terminal domain-containing protein [Paenibacillus alvei]